MTQSSSVSLGHPSSAFRPIVSRGISMKQEISKAIQSLSAVSCRMSRRLFHESGTPKDHLTFRQVQQSSLCGFSVSSLYNSPGKSSFLPKWLTNSIRSLFDALLPLEVDWCCQEQTCLIVMKSPKLLKHYMPCSVVLERYECLSEIYLCTSRKSD